jgi:hypothetical protein
VSGARPALLLRLGGGRSWWAHIEFMPIDIELIIAKKDFEELMNVKGIGEKSFLKLKPMVTVSADKAEKAGDRDAADKAGDT